jgi:hypothetical protein
VFDGTVGGDVEALGRLTEDDLRFLVGHPRHPGGLHAWLLGFRASPSLPARSASHTQPSPLKSINDNMFLALPRIPISLAQRCKHFEIGGDKKTKGAY